MRFSRLLRLALLVPICVLSFISNSGGNVGANSLEGNNYSGYDTIGIGDGGRYVAFSSLASNLVADDTNGTSDIFVRNTETGETKRASVDSTGTQADGASVHPVMNREGDFVVFGSYATNLVSGAINQVFIHDMSTGVTELASVGNEGELPNGPSFNVGEAPSLNAKGDRIAFWSTATNLVSGDTRHEDIFVHDQTNEWTTRVSVGPGGVEADGDSYYPSISADGEHVAFASAATNLVDEDSSGATDIFVRDLDTNVTERVSVGNGGVQAREAALPLRLAATAVT